jgi:hypothetical protein
MFELIKVIFTHVSVKPKSDNMKDEADTFFFTPPSLFLLYNP